MASETSPLLTNNWNKFPSTGSINNANVNIFADDAGKSSNFARLSCLIIEEGTIQMQHYVESHLPYGLNTLAGALRKKKKHFTWLKSKNIISQEKFEILYPLPGCRIETENIDMSLWYVLVRNLTDNGGNIDFKQFENDQGPTEYHVRPVHYIIRLRNLRNKLFHLGSLSSSMKNETFRSLWEEASATLKSLGTTEQVIHNYKTQDLDPMKSLRCYISIKEQVHSELEVMYKNEMQKRKYIFIGFIVGAFWILLLATVIPSVMYFYTATWSSCVNNMEFKYAKNGTAGGAIAYMSKSGWKADKIKHPIAELQLPVPYVVISQSGLPNRCMRTDDCCSLARRVQQISFYRNLDDVAYSFMVGDDGVIYEGRGFHTRPATAGAKWNHKIIAIGFMGTYVTQPPTDEALKTTKDFLQYMVDNGILTKNFTIYGLCQIRDFPFAPGNALYKIIQKWHGPGNISTTWQWRANSNSNYTCSNSTS